MASVACAMRGVLAVATVLLLAGCAAPDADAPDPLFGLCPQWLQGPGEQSTGLRMESNESAVRELGPADARFQELPLDLFRVHIISLESDGVIRLRAEDGAGQRLSVRDYRLEAPQLVPVVVLGSSAAGHDFDVMLSPVLHDGVQAPLPASLSWSVDGGTAVLEYTVSYHYKVCGFDV